MAEENIVRFIQSLLNARKAGDFPEFIWKRLPKAKKMVGGETRESFI